MKKSVLGWVGAGVLAVLGAAFAYLFWFAGGSGEPTTDLTTPPIADASTTSFDDTSQSTTSTMLEAETAHVFVIDQEQSTARFELDEMLNGSPKHVVGTTDQVVGQVRVDDTDLSAVEFSDIVINARTLTTDSERRDRAMRGPVILDSASDEHELITFSVTSVDGLTGEISTGDTVEFTITGDLTVKGATQPVTFDAEVTMLDDTTIQGTAVAEITRDMFEIGIPSVPSVADVTNEVLIALDFVAVAS